MRIVRRTVTTTTELDVEDLTINCPWNNTARVSITRLKLTNIPNTSNIATVHAHGVTIHHDGTTGATVFFHLTGPTLHDVLDTVLTRAQRAD